MAVADQLKEQGYVNRGWLGVAIQDMNQPLSESFGLEKPKGALVSDIVKDSPAEDAGLQRGDIIIAIDDILIDEKRDLDEILNQYFENDVLNIVYVRNREEMEKTVTLTDKK